MPQLDVIIEQTAIQTGVSPEAIKGRCREHIPAEARQIVMYLAYMTTELTLTEIGEELERSAATVWYGSLKIGNRQCKEMVLRYQIQAIKKGVEIEKAK